MTVIRPTRPHLAGLAEVLFRIFAGQSPFTPVDCFKTVTKRVRNHRIR